MQRRAVAGHMVLALIRFVELKSRAFDREKVSDYDEARTLVSAVIISTQLLSLSSRCRSRLLEFNRAAVAVSGSTKRAL